jgi:hypothetical protein
MFIDATYEGDLMAAAGVSYHVAGKQIAIRRKWNGVQTNVFHHAHQFKLNIDLIKFRAINRAAYYLKYQTSPWRIRCS